MNTAPSSISANRVVPLRRVAPLADDGLHIEGICTTLGWCAKEVPVAPGFVRLTPGLIPKQVRTNALPIPLYLDHEYDKKIGEVYALGATDLALHYLACIVPPGTAGFDSDLLARVWHDVLTGKAPAVSIGVKRASASNGSWRLDELSVCAVSRNPFARILKIKAPNGEMLERESLPITHEAVQAAAREQREPARTVTLQMQQQGKVTKVGKIIRDDKGSTTIEIREGPSMTLTKIGKLVRDGQGNATFAVTEVTPQVRTDSSTEPPFEWWGGIWEAGQQYRRGQSATHKGVMWFARRDTTSKPGTDDSWQLMHKSMEVSRRTG
jgi:hypothetical protein